MNQVQIQAAGFRFDNFYLDAANRQLWRDGESIALNSKYFDVLLLLVSRSGQLVEKARIFEEIWSGVFVTDAALTQCIKDIRRQLGDDAANPRYIKTVPKHGYIFIGNAIEAAPNEMMETASDLELSDSTEIDEATASLDTAPSARRRSRALTSFSIITRSRTRGCSSGESWKLKRFARRFSRIVLSSFTVGRASAKARYFAQG